ncbi:MAG: hypothetical protein ACFFCW_12925 [Candidatus Hodarchaeota archaeon]
MLSVFIEMFEEISGVALFPPSPIIFGDVGIAKTVVALVCEIGFPEIVNGPPCP